MALDADAIAWLTTPEGATAADDATRALDAGTALLKVIDSLRRTHGPDRARWAVTLAEGRASARAKFEDTDRLFFDREAAEQATSAAVARHTAQRFAGATRIADLGSGECTVTLTNPVGLSIIPAYMVEINTQAGTFGLDTVTIT